MGANTAPRPVGANSPDISAVPRPPLALTESSLTPVQPNFQSAFHLVPCFLVDPGDNISLPRHRPQSARHHRRRPPLAEDLQQIVHRRV
jgi:hypothetical protein